MSISVDPGVLVAFLLVSTRLLATLTVAPPLGGPAVSVRVRLAVAVSLGFVVGPVQAAALAEAGFEPTVPALVTAIVYQVVVGAMFGFVIQLLLAAPTVAGAMIDYLSGFSAAGLFDPFSGASSTPAARLNQMVVIVVLVALEGHLLIIRGVLRSYEAAPLTGARFDSTGPVLTEGAGQLLLAAIEVALPVLVALLLAEVVLGLAARAAPRLNVMVVGFAVKGLVFMLGFALTLPLIVNGISVLLDRALRWGLGLAGA